MTDALLNTRFATSNFKFRRHLSGFYYALCLVITLSSLLGSKALAHPTKLLDSDTTYGLLPHLEILIEKEGEELDIYGAIQRRAQFQPQSEANANLGYHYTGVWVRVSLLNLSQTENWTLSVNYSQNDQLDFYAVTNNTVLQQSNQGKWRAPNQSRRPNFNLTLATGEITDIYIRARAEASGIILPLRIESERAYFLNAQIDSIFMGMFFGGLLILAIYNLFMYAEIREISLLAYILYIISVLFGQFNWGGHLHLFTGQGLPQIWTQHAELSVSLLFLTSTLFTILFLNTKENLPFWHKLLVAQFTLTVILIFASVTNLIPPHNQLQLLSNAGVLSALTFISTGIAAWRKDIEGSGYFIIAWSIWSVSLSIGMLLLQGILPANSLTINAPQIGIFIEATLFSIALMNKSRSNLQREVDETTLELRQNIELIEEQNARLDIARKDAIKASNIKSQFLANMSHEIRTPLNAIIGFSSELEKNKLPGDALEQAAIIRSSADNLLTIVNDVLDLSKIEAGKFTITNTQFSPLQLLEDITSVMARAAQRKNLSFIVNLEAIPRTLYGDAFRIRQVITNLLSNATKFTNNGFVKLGCRTLNTTPDGVTIEFSVTDSGIGISEQEQGNLFEAFTQLESSLSKNYQGTGLGLTICKQIVDMLDGEIILQSQIGAGSHFAVVVTLPSDAPQDIMRDYTIWDEQRVLLYDPEPESRRAAATMLKRLGANVASADSFDFAVSVSAHYTYCLVCLPTKYERKNDRVVDRLSELQSTIIVLCSDGEPHFNGRYEHPRERFLPLPLTPQRLSQLQENLRRKEASLEQSTSLDIPRATVLAVDDMPFNLKLLSTVLKQTPLTLHIAHSGKEAIELCKQTEYDLILMDIQMPVMDGTQTARIIRKTTANIGTPIIAVTAHALREEQEQLLASGLDDYLPKPIQTQQLFELIHRWCQQHEQVIQGAKKITESAHIDWQAALGKAHQDEHVARDMLTDFVALLPDSLDRIEAAWQRRDLTTLEHEVHKLHGACCYTGVPNLQRIAYDLETCLKQTDLEHADELISRFLSEGKLILSESMLMLSRN